MKYTPPMWLRHIFPWRLLHFIGRHTNVCFIHVAEWKLGDQEPSYENWWPKRSCWDGIPEPFDYCGHYKTGEAFEAATGIPAAVEPR